MSELPSFTVSRIRLIRPDMSAIKPTKSFRTDINGLRAWAVVAVVLYHFDIPGFGGGFVGVDVFFVISGYLMTTIIFSRLARGQFSLWQFYLDRARRIVPAVGFLCLVLFALGWFWLPPEEYKNVGKYGASSLSFISNIVYWRESGSYFEIATHDNWLLHTWSLSVEWQFYLVYPLLIMALRRYLSLGWTRSALLGLTVGSYLLSIYVSSRWPGAAFYLLPTRAWEMLAGGLLVLFPFAMQKRTGALMELSGISLIVISIVFIKTDDVWPGWLAGLPVLGAVLVVAAARTRSVFTSSAAAQFLGKTSYSIYLWHWPMVVALGYYGVTAKLPWVIAAMAASVALGYVSFRFIENPTRTQRTSVNSAPRYAAAVSAVLIIVCAGTLIFFMNGLDRRMSPQYMALTKDLHMPTIRNGWCFYSVDSIPGLAVGKEGLHCELGDKTSKIQGLLFGDSFAGQNEPFWDVIGTNNHVKINAVTTNWCYPSATMDFPTSSRGRAYQQCLINRSFLADHEGDYDFVVFAGLWRSPLDLHQMQGVEDAIAQASSKVKLVILMGAPTSFDVNIGSRYERSILFGSRFDIAQYTKRDDATTAAANDAIKRIAARHPNVLYLDRDSLFNIDGHASDVTRDNIPFSLDGGHISIYGARQSAASFEFTEAYGVVKKMLADLRTQKLATLY